MLSPQVTDHLGMLTTISLPCCSLTSRRASWQPHRTQDWQHPLHARSSCFDRSLRRQERGCRSLVRAQKGTADPGITEVSTPHSGYHYNGAKRRFFEGWYFKVSLA